MPDFTAGLQPRDSFSSTPLQGVRAGVVTQMLHGGGGVFAAVAAGMQRALQHLEALGASVQEVQAHELMPQCARSHSSIADLFAAAFGGQSRSCQPLLGLQCLLPYLSDHGVLSWHVPCTSAESASASISWRTCATHQALCGGSGPIPASAQPARPMRAPGLQEAA